MLINCMLINWLVFFAPRIRAQGRVKISVATRIRAQGRVAISVATPVSDFRKFIVLYRLAE